MQNVENRPWGKIKTPLRHLVSYEGKAKAHVADFKGSEYVYFELKDRAIEGSCSSKNLSLNLKYRGGCLRDALYEPVIQ